MGVNEQFQIVLIVSQVIECFVKVILYDPFIFIY